MWILTPEKSIKNVFFSGMNPNTLSPTSRLREVTGENFTGQRAHDPVSLEMCWKADPCRKPLFSLITQGFPQLNTEGLLEPLQIRNSGKFHIIY
jgi:hypothetical protein